MIGLRLTFTAGRYHATGWDHHVNEGVAEWPPAPWRILRALVAASYRLSAEDRSGVESLVERLCGLPLYRLPAVSKAHLRHYMPTDKSSVKVLDAFVAIDGGARSPSSADVWWPDVELSASERALLERLCTEIAYLGRAESWVELEVINQPAGEPNAEPVERESTMPSDEHVRLLAALPSTELAVWRERFAGSRGGSKAKGDEGLPMTTWDALHADVAKLQRQGWSQAPGAVWADYRLRKSRPTRRSPRVRSTPKVQGMLFQIDSRVLPRIERTLVIAEQMRWALMDVMRPNVHWQFHGKDENRQPRTDHLHAFYLPLESEREDRRGFIDRVLVWTREGFEPEAWEGVETLIRSGGILQDKKKSERSAHPLRLVPVGWGTREQLCGSLKSKAGDLLGPARVWVSATPFVMPRHTKHRKGEIVDSVESQVRASCLAMEELEPETIEPYEGDTSSAFGWSRFVRARLKDTKKAPQPGVGLRLNFAEEISGPLCLGFGLHFGMGRFVAKE